MSMFSAAIALYLAAGIGAGLAIIAIVGRASWQEDLLYISVITITWPYALHIIANYPRENHEHLSTNR